MVLILRKCSPNVLLQLGDRHLVPADDGAGVVDQDVYAPVVVHHLLDHALDLAAVAQVAIDRKGFPAPRLHFFGDRVDAAPTVSDFGGRQVFRFPVHVAQGDVGAQPGQLHHRGPSHAAHPARTGNQRHFAVQSCHFNPHRLGLPRNKSIILHQLP